jgi:hypothetical protein
MGTQSNHEHMVMNRPYHEAALHAAHPGVVHVGHQRRQVEHVGVAVRHLPVVPRKAVAAAHVLEARVVGIIHHADAAEPNLASLALELVAFPPHLLSCLFGQGPVGHLRDPRVDPAVVDVECGLRHRGGELPPSKRRRADSASTSTSTSVWFV